MRTEITWFRISYWVGAIADGIATYRMLFPTYGSGAEYRYAMGIGASLMFGWTIILIWADWKPVARKGVLLITVFPVITGLFLAEIFAVVNEVKTFEQMLPVGVFLVGLIVLFSFSYFNARHVDVEEKSFV